MTRIISKSEIETALAGIDLLAAMERAFVSYSAGKAVVPPVGEMLFPDPPGEVHIKYGYVSGDDYYVVKVASGFYNNPNLGLPSSNGLMLLFSQRNGELLAVLLDQGQLTDVRTAVAGAVVARYFAPDHIDCIGIVGCGVQAEQQLRALATVVDCRRVLVWARDSKRYAPWVARLSDTEFEISTASSVDALVEQCRLLVTTTPSTTPLVQLVKPGTHITAVGSDTAEKQELAASVMASADIVAVDSKQQCQSRGETFRAVAAAAISFDRVVELGDVISGRCPGRIHDEQITVADLTGIATQDIEIAKAVYQEVVNAN